MIKITANTGTEKYKTEIKSDTNTLISDEPRDKGGQDLGFNPGELLAASLASCSTITMKMYAERKGWDLQNAIVEVAYESNTAHSISLMVKTITLQGSLDSEQRARLKYIAGICPIHKLLSQTVKIESVLKDI